jgi:hypothetical protein
MWFHSRVQPTPAGVGTGGGLDEYQRVAAAGGRERLLGAPGVDLRPPRLAPSVDGAALKTRAHHMKPLVEATFRTSQKGHRDRLVRIRLDAPRRARTGEWACRVLATGVTKPTVIRGGDALQAICLALDFLGDRLYDARRRGIRLRFLSADDEVPLSAYFRLREWKRRLAVIAPKHGAGKVRRSRRRRLTSA